MKYLPNQCNFNPLFIFSLDREGSILYRSRTKKIQEIDNMSKREWNNGSGQTVSHVSKTRYNSGCRHNFWCPFEWLIARRLKQKFI